MCFIFCISILRMIFKSRKRQPLCEQGGAGGPTITPLYLNPISIVLNLTFVYNFVSKWLHFNFVLSSKVFFGQTDWSKMYIIKYQ